MFTAEKNVHEYTYVPEEKYTAILLNNYKKSLYKIQNIVGKYSQ
jgi:hypothetical protein